MAPTLELLFRPYNLDRMLHPLDKDKDRLRLHPKVDMLLLLGNSLVGCTLLRLALALELDRRSHRLLVLVLEVW